VTSFWCFGADSWKITDFFQMFSQISRTPDFERSFWVKRWGLYTGVYGTLQNSLVGFCEEKILDSFFCSLGVKRKVQNLRHSVGHVFLVLFLPIQKTVSQNTTQANDSLYLSQTSFRSIMIVLQCATTFLFFVVDPGGLGFISSILDDEEQEETGDDPSPNNVVVQQL